MFVFYRFSRFLATKPVLPHLNLVNFCTNQFKKMTNQGYQLQEVVKKLQQIAPLTLAESWDNVGLLVEPSSTLTVSSALLTIDLTEEVVDEAVHLGAQLIISYHPNIFRPLKSISQKLVPIVEFRVILQIEY